MRQNLIVKNSDRKLWLDLELREDIDDYLTLVFALENGLNVTEVSIRNPSIHEFKLLSQTLAMFGSKAVTIVSGEMSEYSEDKDIHYSLYETARRCKEMAPVSLSEHIQSTDLTDRIIFCGGSLYTLSEVLRASPNILFEAYVQGGYASKKIVGEENTLKKFKKRDSVSTWNLNLDLVASDYVMRASNVECHFISKNICHDSWVHANDVNSDETHFNAVLNAYFEGKDRKCMHDLLAFLTIFNDEIVQFKYVDLYRSYHERPKWHSEINPCSNKQISASFDREIFRNLIVNYGIK